MATTAAPPLTSDIPGASAEVLLLRRELLGGEMASVAELALGEMTVEVRAGRDALWALVSRAGRGSIALRAAHAPGGARAIRVLGKGDRREIHLDSALGRHVVTLQCSLGEVPVLRVTSSLLPAAPLLVPFWPRDLYPLGQRSDPLLARGRVEAAQRGLNTGLLYFRMEEPAFGSVLYFQNLTALNRWFQATNTKPDGAVGGEWPELGYLPPTPPQSGTPPTAPLPAGETITVSDALLAFHDAPEGDEQAQARRYLTLLGAIYRHITPPEPEFHDWMARARASLRDLDRSPKATITHYGHRYVHPYTASEYPDSMVQVATVAALRDWEAWSREPVPLRPQFAAGLRKFFDRRIPSLRRYLPNVGKDKDKDAVDSWYMYHPLKNLGRLALDGDRRARRLFLDSLPHGIRAAHHFDYCWPIQFKIDDFTVITAQRDGDGHGQTDVGGLYAYVMLQAFELCGEQRYLDEARAALDAARGMRFNLNYQANLTAWGAAACMRMWRITAEEFYLDLGYVYLASFFHNTAIWESEIGHARHYRNFLGATALHDAPYMAIYECYDSFAAFERYLKDSGPDLDPAARLLLSEYCRHALDRAWYYYPDALPEEAVAQESRNAHVDRALSFPVEDLYVDGQQAGQVGQEIYGAGAAFVFATRAFHPVEGAPFRLFCDHFLLAMDRPARNSLSFQLGGTEGCLAALRVIRTGREPLPKFRLATLGGDDIAPREEAADHVAFVVPANGRLTLIWP